jgi:serine/threonine-protein kinase
MITNAGLLRPVDFEGACSIDRPDQTVWSTPAFSLRSGPEQENQRQSADLYALGAVIYFLLSGQPPQSPNPVPLESLRKAVPHHVLALVAELLAGEPKLRPDAEEVIRRLKNVATSLADDGVE